MSNWWYSLDFHTIILLVFVLQFINILHHWVVIYLKLKIYRVTICYLSEAEQEQIRVFSVLDAVKQAIEIIKGWAELARIQTSRVSDLNKSVQSQVDNNTNDLAQKITEGTDKVVDKIDHLETKMESGTFTKPK